REASPAPAPGRRASRERRVFCVAWNLPIHVNDGLRTTKERMKLTVPRDAIQTRASHGCRHADAFPPSSAKLDIPPCPRYIDGPLDDAPASRRHSLSVHTSHGCTHRHCTAKRPLALAVSLCRPME